MPKSFKEYLAELSGYHQISDKRFIDLIQNLEDRGKVKIETGSFAAVLVPNNGPWVYKLWLTDPAFEKYISLIRTMNSPHIPKIGTLRTLHNVFTDVDSIHLLPIERLTPLSGQALREIGALVKVLRKIKNDKLTENDIIDLKTLIEVECGPLKIITLSFLRVVIELIQKKMVFKIDFAASNIMLRQEVPVIIDPYFDESFNRRINITASDLLRG